VREFVHARREAHDGARRAFRGGTAIGGPPLLKSRLAEVEVGLAPLEGHPPDRSLWGKFSSAFASEGSEHPWEGFGQIFSDEAGAAANAALAVQPDGGAGGIECWHALGEKAGDDAGQHVA